MAVVTEEDALLRLLQVFGDRLRRVRAQGKALLCRVDVVEAEVDRTAVVAAHRTAAPRLCDQDATDVLLAAGPRLADTALTPPPPLAPAGRVVGEFGQSVLRTRPLFDRALSIRIRGAPLARDKRNRRL